MRAIRLAVWPMLAALLVAPAYGAEGSGEKMFGQERLDRLLTPLARCSDDLLVKILESATYPLEVTQAARLMKANPHLTGPALASALAERTWDPSVKSLVNFPSILRRMNERIDWTQELGDAYLVQKADVMETMQALRQKTGSPAYRDSETGRPSIAYSGPIQGASYGVPLVIRQPGPAPAVSLPDVRYSTQSGPAYPAAGQVWVVTGRNRQGPPPSGGYARTGSARQAAYGGGGPYYPRPWALSVAANFRGRPAARPARARNVAWRR
jgi:hypothetical protein